MINKVFNIFGQGCVCKITDYKLTIKFLICLMCNDIDKMQTLCLQLELIEITSSTRLCYCIIIAYRGTMRSILIRETLIIRRFLFRIDPSNPIEYQIIERALCGARLKSIIKIMRKIVRYETRSVKPGLK